MTLVKYKTNGKIDVSYSFVKQDSRIRVESKTYTKNFNLYDWSDGLIYIRDLIRVRGFSLLEKKKEADIKPNVYHKKYGYGALEPGNSGVIWVQFSNSKILFRNMDELEVIKEEEKTKPAPTKDLPVRNIQHKEATVQKIDIHPISLDMDQIESTDYNIYYLGPYQPLGLVGFKDRDPFSNMVGRLKPSNSQAYYYRYKVEEAKKVFVRRLLNEFDSLLNKVRSFQNPETRLFQSTYVKRNNGIYITAIPSSKKDAPLSHIQDVAQRIVQEKDAIDTGLMDGTALWIRSADKPKYSIREGNRERGANYKTLEIIHPEMVKDQVIIVLDDVYTTGNTMMDAIDLLKDNGAKEVVGVAIGRTILG